jgi:hypothetical protein
MKLAFRAFLFSALFLTVTLSLRPALAQEGPLENNPPQGTTVE